MSDRLDMSVSGYSKIERDETDISLKRLQQIAEILEVDYNSILSIDEKQVFNFHQNQNANGIVQIQQLVDLSVLEKLINQLKEENQFLKDLIQRPN